MGNLILEVEITFKEGKKAIEMTVKSPFDIMECEEGKVVVLNLKDGSEYTGFFDEVDDDIISLKSLKTGYSLGFEMEWVSEYLEQVETVEK